ncbi:MAG: hypothetical protein IBX43_04960 [Campylobacterales bacterium]|nr:hypothetical protein [Campylobacterales bacterium]
MGEIREADGKRDEWEIKEDLRAVKRAMHIFRDKERLKDVQEMIKSEKSARESMDAVAEGDLQKALGF